MEVGKQSYKLKVWKKVTVVKSSKEEEEKSEQGSGDTVLRVCGPGWAKETFPGVEQEVQRGPRSGKQRKPEHKGSLTTLPLRQ